MPRTLICLLLIIVVSACSRHDALWEEARDEDSVAAYEAYLERYPDGPRAQQARSRARTLQVEQAWRDARERDSRSAYETFLESWPDSEFADEARSRIAARQRAETWRSLAASDDIARLEAFAEQHRGSPEASLAADRIAALREEAAADESAAEDATRERPAAGPSRDDTRDAADADEGTHRVQLAAVSSAARARDGIARFERDYAEILGGVELRSEPAGDMHRLLTTPLSRDRATSLCEALKAAGQDCIVRAR